MLPHMNFSISIGRLSLSRYVCCLQIVIFAVVFLVHFFLSSTDAYMCACKLDVRVLMRVCFIVVLFLWLLLLCSVASWLLANVSLFYLIANVYATRFHFVEISTRKLK